MKRSAILPRWFRVLIAGSFASFLLAAFLLRDGMTGAAAYALFQQLAAPAAPLLESQGMLGATRAMPAKGDYRLNGMRVRFDTVGTPQGSGRVLVEIEEMMARAGYLHRIVPIHGLPMTVGIHPETKVMLIAMPGRDLEGNPVVRLTQQNLGELRGNFKAEIPGIPVYPGARGQTLIESLDDPPSTSLSYAAGGLPADIRAHYLREMPLRGWTRIDDPLGPTGLPVEVVFFERDGVECSVLVSALPETAHSLVMVSLNGDLPEA